MEYARIETSIWQPPLLYFKLPFHNLFGSVTHVVQPLKHFTNVILACDRYWRKYLAKEGKESFDVHTTFQRNDYVYKKFLFNLLVAFFLLIVFKV
jgi:hypothetical protein